MIVNAFLAIKQSTFTTIRDNWSSVPEWARDSLKHFRTQWENGETWHKTVVKGGATYRVFNSLADFNDLARIDAQWPNAIIELLVLNVQGLPPGVERTENGYTGTPLWEPTGANATGLAWWVEAMNKIRQLYDANGNPSGTGTLPKGYIPLFVGGWPGPDVDYWETLVGEIVWN